MRRLTGVMLAGAIVSGCGGGSDESRTTMTVSCTFADFGCDELTAQLTAAELTDLRASCGSNAGTFGTTCSATGKVPGHCQYAGAAAVAYGIPYPGAVLNQYYDTAGWTLTSAQAFCADPPAGVWVP